MTGTNSESRKAGRGKPEWLIEQERIGAARLAAQDERRRELTQQALAAVYSGAGFLEADAFLDHLRDFGADIALSNEAIAAAYREVMP